MPIASAAGRVNPPPSLFRTIAAGLVPLLLATAVPAGAAPAGAPPAPETGSLPAREGEPGRSTSSGPGALVPLDVVQPVLNGVNDTPDHEVQFGRAIAIDDDWLLVGVPARMDSSGQRRGAVFFFQRVSPGRWQQRQRILFGSGESARCGSSVALRGRHAVVGCPEHTGGGLFARGRTTFFERDPATGEYGNAQSVLGEAATQRCGTSVAMHGTGEVGTTWAVSGCVGGNGTVDVFQRVSSPGGGESWQRIQTLANPGPPGGGDFGRSVALFRAPSGLVRIAVGDPNHHHGGTASFGGIAYLFLRAAAGGLFTQELSRSRPGGPQPFDHCGASVALGAVDWFAGCPGITEGGRVLAFDFNGTLWSAGTAVAPPSGLAEPDSQFGFAVATSASGTQGGLWVGQPRASGQGNAEGRLHRFQRVGGGPTPQPAIYVPVAHWHAADLVAPRYAELGSSVAVDNATDAAAVGAPFAEIPAPWGEVILFGPDRIFANGLGCGTGLPGC